MDQTAVPEPGPAGVDVDRHLRVLDKPVPRREASRHDVLVGAGRVDVEEHAAAGEVGPPAPPVAGELGAIPEAAGDGAGEAEDGAVVEEWIEDRRGVGQRQVVGRHRPPVIGGQCGGCGGRGRGGLLGLIEQAKTVEVAPLTESAAADGGEEPESGEEVCQTEMGVRSARPGRPPDRRTEREQGQKRHHSGTLLHGPLESFSSEPSAPRSLGIQ